MGKPRIVSLLPAATEIVCALGLEDQLVGITHECNYPLHIKSKPCVVRSAIDLSAMTPVEIDSAVSERMRNNESLYEIDEDLLRGLRPDIVITQDLCQVCAPSGSQIEQVLNSLMPKPNLVWTSPSSIAGIFKNITDIGEATAAAEEAAALVAGLKQRIDFVRERTRTLPRAVPVFFMEWVEPLFCAGHWVPEMIKLAGGVDALGRAEADSVRVSWPEVIKSHPELVIVSPCGYDLAGSLKQLPQLLQAPGWVELNQSSKIKLFAVDADSYFARPGPRVVDGIELLAHLMHPDRFEWKGARNSFLACPNT